MDMSRTPIDLIMARLPVTVVEKFFARDFKGHWQKAQRSEVPLCAYAFAFRALWREKSGSDLKRDGVMRAQLTKTSRFRAIIFGSALRHMRTAATRFFNGPSHQQGESNKRRESVKCVFCVFAGHPFSVHRSIF